MRAPAFQCYAADRLADGAVMTHEEFGMFWRLALVAWRDEGIADDLSVIARIVHVSRRKLERAWVTIGQQFERRDNRLVIPWQEAERVKQAEFSEKMRSAASKRWSNDDAKALPTHSQRKAKAKPKQSQRYALQFASAVEPTPPNGGAPLAADATPPLPTGQPALPPHDNAGGGGWPARFRGIFAKHGKYYKHGVVGALLKEQVAIHGEDRLAEAAEEFLERGVSLHGEKEQFITLPKFAEHAGRWVDLITPADQLPEHRREALGIGR